MTPLLVVPLCCTSSNSKKENRFRAMGFVLHVDKAIKLCRSGETVDSSSVLLGAAMTLNRLLFKAKHLVSRPLEEEKQKAPCCV